MRIPRDINAQGLIKTLAIYGYTITRQTGSHIRLTSVIKGSEHHVTIPNHAEIRIGTVNAILSDVADYLQISKEEIITRL